MTVRSSSVGSLCEGHWRRVEKQRDGENELGDFGYSSGCEVELERESSSDFPGDRDNMVEFTKPQLLTQYQTHIHDPLTFPSNSKTPYRNSKPSPSCRYSDPRTNLHRRSVQSRPNGRLLQGKVQQSFFQTFAREACWRFRR